ncbi:MAG: hypothetical protein IPM83_08205 [Ignavibacteria bacterium]|nr:hypothetical protein [Ignavibacteria bacterium]
MVWIRLLLGAWALSFADFVPYSAEFVFGSLRLARDVLAFRVGASATIRDVVLTLVIDNGIGRYGINGGILPGLPTR